MKYVKVSWWSAVWLLGMVAFGVYGALRNDWIAFGVDIGAALILWPLSAASQRDREMEQANLREWAATWAATFNKLADGDEVSLRKVEGGYEPVETPVEE